jgi:sporadic carbohydrate cluster 2OG-Fe(II) oxygenase
MKNFFSKSENKIVNKFNKNGYIIFDIKKKKQLNNIRKKILILSRKNLRKKITKIESIHNHLTKKELNKFRMKIYSELNKSKNFLSNYYSLGDDFLDVICGNELVMQRKVNLSIQMPDDDSSLLPLHSDVWSGCSPFEVVLWIPLVNCKKTQSMFIMPKILNEQYYAKIQNFNSVTEIEQQVKKKVKWLTLKYGQGLIFLHSIMHGNVVNKEKDTRWSFNCRFKSVFSPYDDKSIGETFFPITLRPASISGMQYSEPKVKNARF